MAKSWDTVRKEAVATGRVNEERVAAHKARMLGEQRAYRLADVRRAHGLTQVDVAKTMHVTQSRISAFEKGELTVSEVGTIAKYVEAIGGKLRLVADFGDEQVIVG